MRKLATIRKISDISPIEGADKIELATVDGWKVVVAKDVGHKVDDFVIYCEVDSFLPVRPEFEFLRKTSFRKMGDKEGFRLKTIKMRGQVSQGLILPISVIEGQLDWGPYITEFEIIEQCFKEGTDLSELLGIVKYEQPIPAQLAGVMKGGFPSFLKKTDEERIQNLTEEYAQWEKDEVVFYETEKLDGSSATFYINDDVFGVCSRNLELTEDYTNSFWKVARELDLENKMRKLQEKEGYNFSLQGELIGEGIQGNPYKIKGQTVRFFNLFNIDTQERENIFMLKYVTKELELESVPLINMQLRLPYTIDLLLKHVEGKSLLNSQANREGSVFRTLDGKISFKVISNQFLLKEK